MALSGYIAYFIIIIAFIYGLKDKNTIVVDLILILLISDITMRLLNKYKKKKDTKGKLFKQ